MKVRRLAEGRRGVRSTGPSGITLSSATRVLLQMSPDETWEPHPSKVKSGSPQAVLAPHLLVTNLLTLSFLQSLQLHSCLCAQLGSGYTSLWQPTVLAIRPDYIP